MSLDTVVLRDEFSDTVAAGGVNGTTATDGTNTRTATDGNGKMSIGSGVLSFATGGVGAGNPGLWYPLRTRFAGLMVTAKLNQSSAGLAAGFDTNQSGSLNNAIVLNGTTLQIIANGTTITVGSISLSTDYIVYVALRATGAHFYIQGGTFTYPLLIFISATGNANEYPSVVAIGTTSIGSADYIRSAGYYLASPLVSHGFDSVVSPTDGNGHAETSGLGSGGNNIALSGNTWSVSGGKGINTPPLQSESVINGDFATDTVWTKGTNWTISGGVATATTVNGTDLYQAALTIGKWYRITYSATFSSGQSRVLLGSLAGALSSSTSPFMTGRATTAFAGVRGQGPMTGTIDNFSAKELLLKDLLSLYSSSTPDVLLGIDITVVTDTQVGMALNWDSSSNPQNGVLVYFDGTNCKIDKCVAGVWTNVLSSAATVSRLIVGKIASSYRVYTPTASIGSVTIADAGIINNTLHGWFNTYEGNTVDNWTVYASGSSGEYATAFDIVLNSSATERSGDYAAMSTVMELPSGVIEHGSDNDHGLLGTGLRSVIAATVYGPSSLN